MNVNRGNISILLSLTHRLALSLGSWRCERTTRSTTPSELITQKHIESKLFVKSRRERVRNPISIAFYYNVFWKQRGIEFVASRRFGVIHLLLRRCVRRLLSRIRTIHISNSSYALLLKFVSRFGEMQSGAFGVEGNACRSCKTNLRRICHAKATEFRIFNYSNNTKNSSMAERFVNWLKARTAKVIALEWAHTWQNVQLAKNRGVSPSHICPDQLNRFCRAFSLIFLPLTQLKDKIARVSIKETKPFRPNSPSESERVRGRDEVTNTLVRA